MTKRISFFGTRLGGWFLAIAIPVLMGLSHAWLLAISIPVLMGLSHAWLAGESLAASLVTALPIAALAITAYQAVKDGKAAPA